MNIIEKIAKELGIRKGQAEAAVKLIDEGNTIPFIARYRKEATGELNDEQLRNLHERLLYLRGLEERKAAVLSSIEEQGALTEELRGKIEAAETMVLVEDLYRPYKPKRKTRASVAKEKGLEPLAAFIKEQNATEPLLTEAAKYVNPEKEVETAEQALQGAMDILAEAISDEADYRTRIREMTLREGILTSEAKDPKTASVYEMYYAYQEPLSKAAGHRVLALNRGEKEKILTVKIIAPEENCIGYLEKQTITKENAFTTPVLKEAAQDSYHRLIQPAIEREIRNELTEKAEDGAMHVFGKNLEQLLMQPPIAGRVVLGWDPAFRTGCKLAVVDSTGKILETTVVFPTAPQNKVKEAKAEVKKLIQKHGISLISVGNGTASRESEQVIVEMLKELNKPVQYVIVSEAGASVYSASKLATQELPDLNVGERSAASIARRLQDPLAELVKIDPKAIGIGQYQHDMNQKKLGDTLGGVVEDCVNKVGVDLNTASAPLLEHISGISAAIAKNIVAYREENGRFQSRKQLLKVPKLGPKAYEQCAGFLRIHDGENPLDDTSVHPESYEAANALMNRMGITMEEVRAAQKNPQKPLAGADEAAGAAVKTAKGDARENGGNDRASQNAKGAAAKGSTVKGKTMNTAFGLALAKSGIMDTLQEQNASSAKASGKKNGAGKRSANQNAAQSAAAQNMAAFRSLGDKDALAKELGIGVITLEDIWKELCKPSRDPRSDMPAPVLRSDVLAMEDLKPGMILKGTVRNIVDFGAFVDIGVHEDGLVHVSQICDRFIKHPLEAVSVGDVVEVQVLTVDVAKKRIGLTMKIKAEKK